MNFYQVTNKSFKELGVKTLKGLWNKVKKDHKGLSSSVSTKFKKVKDSDKRFRVVMSTASEDRHGDIVEQNFDLKPFKKNPVLLDSHNYGSIEHVVGKVNKTSVKENKLKGEVEFMRDNPKGVLAEKMVDGGFINAVSIGFIPKEFDEKTGNIKKSELLELSLVSVPANAEALFEKAEKKFGKVKAKKKEIEIVEKTAREKKIESLNRIVNKEEEKRKRLYRESLAVIRQLSRGTVEPQKRRQMANRVIRQMIKTKK